MKRRAFVISLPILIDKSECCNLTSVPPKKNVALPLTTLYLLHKDRLSYLDLRTTCEHLHHVYGALGGH